MYQGPPSYNAGAPPPQPSPQQATVYLNSGPTIWGPNPQHTVCPSCHAQVTTRIETEAITKTHLFAFLLCLFQCYLCCWIPYCVDSCKGKKHYCPNCQAYLGSPEN